MGSHRRFRTRNIHDCLFDHTNDADSRNCVGRWKFYLAGSVGKYRDRCWGTHCIPFSFNSLDPFHPFATHMESTNIKTQIILTCLPVLAPLFKVLRQKLSSSDRSQGNPYLHTDNHGLQVFSGNESNNRNTITVANARLGRVSRYPEDESDNESQETILGKGVGEIEGTMGSRDVERDAGRGEGRSVNGGQSQSRKETAGIMRTMEVRVDVESGPAFEGR